MRRRFVYAVAALAVLAVGVLVPAAPAVAAPAPGALCTPAEWQDPAKMSDCAAKLNQQLTQAENCLSGPTPTSPSEGVAGWVDKAPDSSKQSGRPGRYSDYGVAGYQLTTYDLSCAGAVLHPEASMETAIADAVFSLSADILGVDNAVRDEAYDPHSLWGWSDSFIERLDNAFFTGAFGGILSLALVMVGIYLIVQSRHGNMSKAAGTAGWAVAVTVLCTAVLQWPVQAAHLADSAGTGALQVTHQLVGPSGGPAVPCVLPDPDACVDHRTAATKASDTVTDSLLYQNWLRAELGSADSVTAKTYGPALFNAQVFTWGEVNASTDPATKAVMVARKQQQWMNVAAIIKVQDPTAYQNLQGLHGTDRIGVSLITLASVSIFSGFDLIASLIILLAFAVIRFAVIAAPIFGSIGVFHRTAGPFIRVMTMLQAALVNLVIYGLMSALFLFFVDLIFNSSGLPGPLQTGLMLLAVIVCWLMFRPVVRLRRGAGDDRPVGLGILRVVLNAYTESRGARPAGEGPIYATATTTNSHRQAGQPALWNRPE